MKKLQESITKFFSSKTTLIVNAAIGGALWITNAVFNLLAGDYLAFAINLMYVTFINVTAAAAIRHVESTLQGAVGGLMATFLLGNINVLVEMTGRAPSRNLWQLIVSIILALILFANHFMLTSEKRRKMWRIQVNQIVIALLLLLRVYQILANIIGYAGASDTGFLIEITVGLLAIIPTLNVVVCTECMTGAYGCK